jgi:ribosomal protein S7
MRKIKKYSRPSILIDKFINLLIQNGKKSKSKKLFANCSAYTDKLLKKNYLKSMVEKNKKSRTMANLSTLPSPVNKKKSGNKIYQQSNNIKKFFPSIENLLKIKNLKPSKKALSFHYRKNNFQLKRKKVEVMKRYREGFPSIDQKTKQEKNVDLKSEKNRQRGGITKKFLFLNPQMVPFEKVRYTAILFFQKSIKKVSPLLYLQKLRKGGRTKYIPRALSKEKGMCVAIKWVIDSSKKRENTSSRYIYNVAKISQLISNELCHCFLEQGPSWQKKEELHKLGGANKAFIRYNWW